MKWDTCVQRINISSLLPIRMRYLHLFQSVS
jgi:hypothetical protein